MSHESMPELCEAVEEHLADILDGSAAEALFEHLADCDRCRDARYFAESGAALARNAGADYRAPSDLEARLERALGAERHDTTAENSEAQRARDEQSTPGREHENGGTSASPDLASAASERHAQDGAEPTRSPQASERDPAASAASERHAQDGAEPTRSPQASERDPAASERHAQDGAEPTRSPQANERDPAASATSERRAHDSAEPARSPQASEREPAASAASGVGGTGAVSPRGGLRRGRVGGNTNKTPDGNTNKTPDGNTNKTPGGNTNKTGREHKQNHKARVLGAAIALSVAASAALFLGKRAHPGVAGGTSGWQGKAAHVTTALGGNAGLSVCDAAGSACRTLGVGEPFSAGSVVKTDEHTRAQLALDDGTTLALDRSSEIALDPTHARLLSLRRGALVADVAHAPNAPARFDVPLGHVEVLGTKFALRASSDAAVLDVTRGNVRFFSRDDRSVEVRAGEEARLEPAMPPIVSAAPALGESLTFAEPLAVERATEVRGLGELRAKKPGGDRELSGAVTLSSHAVKVRIAGAVARTEVDEVFTNRTGDVLEGIYRFPMPPGAQIERLALEVDGKLEEGAFVPRERASAIWRGAIVNVAPQMRNTIQDEIVWVPGPWKDPALLEWQRAGRFELRIFPIPKHGSRRVVLSYTELVKPTAGVRRYTYPLAHDPSGSTRVRDFSVDLQVRGQDAGFGVRPRGYPLSRASGSDAESFTFRADDFVPSGDLNVEYALPDRDAELSAYGYRRPADEKSSSEKYVALLLRPKLPKTREDGARAFVLVVDASRSAFGESYRRARELAVRTIAELEPSDRVSVLACDTDCRALPGGLLPPSAELAARAQQFLSGITPEGASDIARSMQRAAEAGRNDEGRRVRVVYIGDGSSSVGPIRPLVVEHAVKAAIPPELGTVTAVAVGTDSDLDTLSAVARGGGGVVLPYVPGESSANAAYAILGATYQAALRDVQLELPPGLVEVAPRALDSLLSGSESLVVAKTGEDRIEGTIVLSGRLGDQRFERRYPLKLGISDAKGNAFVPRLFAATRIVDLERDSLPSAKTEAVRLSSAFGVASRYTSLLVLESPAMFKAFGLDNTRRELEFNAGEVPIEGDAEEKSEVLSKDDGLASADKKASNAFGGGAASGRSASLSGLAADRFDSAPATAQGAPMASAAPAPAPSRPATKAAEAGPGLDAFEFERPQRRVRWIPMRRIWERHGSIVNERLVPKLASPSEIEKLERLEEQSPNRRDLVKKLYTLYSLASDLERAERLAETWSSKEPLDTEALTARADLAARSGDRELAIRILGSVVDVRPADSKAQERLARLERWAGRPLEGCRYSIANAEFHPEKVAFLVDAVRCARRTGEALLAEDLLSLAEPSVRLQTEAALAKPEADSRDLSGDLRLEAAWQGGADVDLALLDADGNRISWLGAPTRAVITAQDVRSSSREGLALRGAKPGEYVIEVVRATGEGPIHGELQVLVAGARRTLPFSLVGNRATVGLARLSLEPRLVPL